MSSKHRLTRSFRTISAIIYVLNTICTVKFAIIKDYLQILIGSLMTIICIVMLIVTVEAPKMITERLERSKIGEQLFTFRGRYMVDFILSLFLFAMGIWGILLGVCTLALIFGIRFLGVKQPDAFNEIFRQSTSDHPIDGNSGGTDDSYAMESQYDAPPVGR